MNAIIPLIGVGLITNACSEDPSEQPSQEREVLINTDPSTLESRLTEMDEAINIIPAEGAGRAASNVTLRLKGELAPPVVAGKTLQATSIAERKDFFVVSYNFRGEEYGGAIDLVNDRLRMKSQILFSDADISDIAFSGDNLYFVGASASLEEPAFIERIRLKATEETFSLDNNERISLGYYVANSVTANNGEIYVTTGDDETRGGGLYKLDKDLNRLTYKRKADARWVDVIGDRVFSTTGTDGEVFVWNKADMTRERKFRHNGGIESESKMTIDVANNKVFVAGGREGLLVYDLEGNFITKYTFGNGAITNAVTAYRGKVFISNGEAGIHVASYDPFLELIGRLDLESNESVNHIALHDNFLYVASGLGGVKMIKVID